MRSKIVSDIGDYLMRLIMGRKTDPALPEPINVLTFVKRVDKDIDGLHQYNNLSEFAHPNLVELAPRYSKDDPTNLWTDFGANLDSESSKHIGVVNLSVALMFFERSYNRIGDLIPGFITLCESQLKASRTHRKRRAHRRDRCVSRHHLDHVKFFEVLRKSKP